MVRHAVAGALLSALVPAAAAAAPAFGPEFPLATDHATFARMAASESLFLVVWFDSSTPAILGRLVRASDGQATGGAFVISTDVGGGSVPGVGSDGTGFLVAWTAAAGDLRAARVSATGRVLDADGFRVMRAREDDPYGGASPWRPAVAWNGSEWLVGWAGSFDDNPVTKYDLVTAGGVALNTAGNFAPGYGPPEIAATGASFLLTNLRDDDETDVGDAEIDADGAVATNGYVERSNDYPGQDDALAGNGTSYVATYDCTCGPADGSAPFRTWSVALDSMGVADETTRAPVSGPLLADPSGQYRYSAVTYGGGRWWIARDEFGGTTPSVFVDDGKAFDDAAAPQIAWASAGSGLVVAMRGASIVARTFEPAAGATPTPTPTATATESGSPTASATPTATASASPGPSATATPPPQGTRPHGGGGGGCAVASGEATSAGLGLLLGVAALLIGGRRRSADA